MYPGRARRWLNTYSSNQHLDTSSRPRGTWPCYGWGCSARGQNLDPKWSKSPKIKKSRFNKKSRVQKIQFDENKGLKSKNYTKTKGSKSESKENGGPNDRGGVNKGGSKDRVDHLKMGGLLSQAYPPVVIIVSPPPLGSPPARDIHHEKGRFIPGSLIYYNTHHIHYSNDNILYKYIFFWASAISVIINSAFTDLPRIQQCTVGFIAGFYSGILCVKMCYWKLFQALLVLCSIAAQYNRHWKMKLCCFMPPLCTLFRLSTGNTYIYYGVLTLFCD